MKYKTLTELQEAFRDGKLDRNKHSVVVDNDKITLYVRDEDNEDDDGECVFLIEDLPRYVLVQALALLGIPARQA